LRRTKKWELVLYVVGKKTRSKIAFENIDKICATYLKGQYHITVIDLKNNPKLAIDEQIFAVTTLVRKSPEPVIKIIGDLSHIEKVINGLDINP
jgi:circadian clock protein KaiB